MPKFNKTPSALEKTRKLLKPIEIKIADSSSDSELSSAESAEFSHIPIPNLNINVSQLSIHDTENRMMEQLATQLQQLTQQLAAYSSRQAEQDSEINQLRMANQSRNHQVNNGNETLQILSRIPDPIKGIPHFDGNRRQLHAWINTAETTLARFQPLVGDDVYEIYEQAVFNKIEGRAKDIICLAGNPSSFQEIKHILIEAIGDRQELSTYKARLWSNKQTPDMTIKQYYNKTKEIVQNIKTISKQDPLFSAHWDAILKFIDQDALAAFMAGLKAPYQGYAQASGPKDLEDAYAFLCKFQSTEKIAESHKQNNFNKNSRDGFAHKKDLPSSLNYQKDSGYGNKQGNSHSHHKPSNSPPKTEPMETRTTRSRLTVNNLVTDHVEDNPPGSDCESEDDLDLNFHLVGGTTKKT